MNKRIKELAEQAREHARSYVEDCKHYGYHMEINESHEYEEQFEQKFAELIGRECVSLFDGSEEMKTVGFLSHKQIVDKIEEHFGVEK